MVTTGDVAVVTGASSGIGRHIATCLADCGATVVAAARRRARLDELADGQDGIVPVECDVTRPEQVAHLTEVCGLLGGPSVLVNAAGVDHDGAAIETTPEAFRRVMEVNVLGVLEVSRSLVDLHVRTHGEGGVRSMSIINIGSIYGRSASWPFRQSAYGASKGAVDALTRHLAAEWAALGIRVNCLAPGWFPSEMTDGWIGTADGGRFISNRAALKRAGSLRELDGVCRYLASEESSYVTGQILSVDGGWRL